MVRRDGAAQAGVRSGGSEGGQAMRPSSSSSSSARPIPLSPPSHHHPSRPLCSRRRIVFFRPPSPSPLFPRCQLARWCARPIRFRRWIPKSPSYACARRRGRAPKTAPRRGRAMRFLLRFTARSSPITITPTRRNAPRLERGVATTMTTMPVARGGATSWTAAGPCARRRRMMEGKEALALIRRRGSVRR